jgi:predicted permease
MLAAFEALAPVFVLIVLGAVIRRRVFLPAAFWPGAERLVYLVLFPALLIGATATANLEGVPGGALIAASWSALAAIGALALVAARVLRLGGPATTSVFQAAIRGNGYVGLAAAAALHGPEGLALMGLVVAVVVPTVNAASVVCLVMAGHRRASPGPILRELARNPLILACAAGIGLNLAGVVLPGVATSLLDILAGGALPLGLLCVGAGLELRGLRVALTPLGAAAALKLLALPAVTVLAVRLLGLPADLATAAVLLAGMPVAPSSYVLARELGGDAPLLAGAITLTTLLATATLPLLATLVG